MAREKVLTAKDISVIIRACKSSGVTKLQFGDLLIDFEPETATSHDELNHFIQEPIEFKTLDSETKSEPSPEALDHMMIMNPAAWEEHISQQE